MFQRRHYQSVADYIVSIASRRSLYFLNEFTEEVVCFFSEQSNFDEDRFRKACGQEHDDELGWVFFPDKIKKRTEILTMVNHE